MDGASGGFSDDFADRALLYSSEVQQPGRLYVPRIGRE